MATRKSKAQKRKEHVCYEKGKGYTVQKGKYQLADGTFKFRKFYLGEDLAEAQRKKNLIVNAWETLQLKGIQYWTNEALAELRDAGAITNKVAKGVYLNAANAIKFYPEPLNDPDLLPLCDSKGMLKRENAIDAIKIDLFNAIGTTEFRSDLHKEFRRLSKESAIRALTTLKNLFPNIFESIAPQFLFNVNGSMSVTPIAHDASDGKKIDLGLIEDGGA